MSRVKLLIYAGYVEAASFLLLLGFAMPMKYWFGMPQFVSVLGWAHGVLFVGYLMILIVVSIAERLAWWSISAGMLGAVLPFGPVVYDRALLKSVQA